MARAIWSGVLSFGLVSVPVQMFTATESHEPTFHQFQKDTSDRIRYQRINERTGDEVPYSEIVKGADVGDGNYVMLDQDELDSVAPGRSRSLDIQSFVDLDEIDPIYFSKTYFLGPRGEETKKTYALLRDAMADSNRAAIATFVMRSREYLAAVRADGDVLMMDTLLFADEIRDARTELPDLPGEVSFTAPEITMAAQLIEAMSGPWKPEDYRDTYTDRVNDLIEAKRKDQAVTVTDEAPAPTNVIDLTRALQASLDAARSKPADGKSGDGKSADRKSAARGAADRKTADRKHA
jgi:DNA end-binding protein Ku